MYLDDSDVIQFLQNALCWLRPGGYIHLRESCTEPSSGSGKLSFSQFLNFQDCYEITFNLFEF